MMSSSFGWKKDTTYWIKTLPVSYLTGDFILWELSGVRQDPEQPFTLSLKESRHAVYLPDVSLAYVSERPSEIQDEDVNYDSSSISCPATTSSFQSSSLRRPWVCFCFFSFLQHGRQEWWAACWQLTFTRRIGLARSILHGSEQQKRCRGEKTPSEKDKTILSTLCFFLFLFYFSLCLVASSRQICSFFLFKKKNNNTHQQFFFTAPLSLLAKCLFFFFSFLNLLFSPL